MKALVFRDNQLSVINDRPEPQPAADEVVIDVRLAGICRTHIEITRGYMSFEGVLGHECVGVVSRAGGAAGKKWLDRRVVCEINCVCGKCDMCLTGLRNHCRQRTVIGISGRDGAFADYIVVPQRNCHRVPETMSDEEAVFVEPLAAAIQVVKQVPVDSRMKVTVLGDGRLGLLVGQVLQSVGCSPRLVGKHPKKMAFAEKRSIRVVPLEDLKPANTDDLVVDCTGSPKGLETAMQLVRPRGIIMLKSTCAAGEPLNLSPLVINEVHLIGSRCGPFLEAIEMLAKKEVNVSGLISRRFKFDRSLDAIRAAGDHDSLKILLAM
ncbi:MAG: alcohol dehydrogenase catalytic domain-containing protein [Phycisphaerae bacterium]|nr:alcohol dehydrogenase catalytic domain-containing protein [Phycisphaerae bacterium]